MKKNFKSLTIILPALNEEKNIDKITSEIYQAAKVQLDQFEIIIVDDGSVDKTYFLSTELVKKLGPEIKVIRKANNEGIGSAFISGVNNSQCKNITCIPSDGAYQIEGIKSVFSEVGCVPIILGYRANINERPLFRRFLSGCITVYVRILTGKKVKDVQGMLVAPVNLIKEIHISYAKYVFHMQLISFLLNRSIEYKQVPVNYSTDADANSGMLRIPVLRDVIRTACQLLLLKVLGKLS